MTSYLTVAEYRAAPTAIDSNNLVQGGNQATQDAVLAEVIRQASSWMDTVVSQPLIASSYIDQQTVRVQRNGSLSIHPRRAPLNQLTAVSIGVHAGNLTAISDLTGAYIDDEQWVIPTGVSFSAGLSLAAVRPRQVLARATMIAGWPNTTLTVAPAANATQITVASGVGFTPAIGSVVADEPVTIIDGVNTETVTVSSVAGNVLTCSTLAFAHTVGVPVSMLPADIKKAAVLATSAFIRDRGGESGTMGTQAQPGNVVGDATAATWIGRAMRMLATYTRNR